MSYKRNHHDNINRSKTCCYLREYSNCHDNVYYPPSGYTMDCNIVPHENDILLGRGGKNNQHIGNEKLRNLARSQRERYKQSSKKDKSNMSRELVRHVRSLNPPGRFLRRSQVTGTWEDVGDEIAREKTSQALRDAVSISIGIKESNDQEVICVSEPPPTCPISYSKEAAQIYDTSGRSEVPSYRLPLSSQQKFTPSLVSSHSCTEDLYNSPQSAQALGSPSSLSSDSPTDSCSKKLSFTSHALTDPTTEDDIRKKRSKQPFTDILKKDNDEYLFSHNASIASFNPPRLASLERVITKLRGPSVLKVNNQKYQYKSNTDYESSLNHSGNQKILTGGEEDQDDFDLFDCALQKVDLEDLDVNKNDIELDSLDGN